MERAEVVSILPQAVHPAAGSFILTIGERTQQSGLSGNWLLDDAWTHDYMGASGGTKLPEISRMTRVTLNLATTLV